MAPQKQNTNPKKASIFSRAGTWLKKHWLKATGFLILGTAIGVAAVYAWPLILAVGSLVGVAATVPVGAGIIGGIVGAIVIGVVVKALAVRKAKNKDLAHADEITKIKVFHNNKERAHAEEIAKIKADHKNELRTLPPPLERQQSSSSLSSDKSYEQLPLAPSPPELFNMLHNIVASNKEQTEAYKAQTEESKKIYQNIQSFISNLSPPQQPQPQERVLPGHVDKTAPQFASSPIGRHQAPAPQPSTVKSKSPSPPSPPLPKNSSLSTVVSSNEVTPPAATPGKRSSRESQV